MDISTDFKDAPPALVAALQDPAVAAAIAAYADRVKAPLVSKNTELLGEVRTHKSFIDGLGGTEKITGLATAAAAAAEKLRLKTLESTDVEAVRRALNGEIQSRDDQIGTLLNGLKTNEVNRQIAATLAEAGGSAELLTPHINSRLKSEISKDGVVSINVLKDGIPWLMGTEAKPATLKDLVAEMKTNTTFTPAFKASGMNGSGAKGTPQGLHGVVNPWAEGSFNLTRQSEVYKANPEHAAALAAAAGVQLNA